MKKLLAMTLAVLMCVTALASCSFGQNENENSQESSSDVTDDSRDTSDVTEDNTDADTKTEETSGSAESDGETDTDEETQTESEAGEDSEATESVEDTEAEPEIEYDENGYQKDNLPEELDFGGREINISGWSEVENKYPEFGIKELGANKVNNAAYLKNVAVERRLNVRLKFDTVKGWTGRGDGSGQEQLTRVQTAAATGDIDLIGTYSWNACTFMVNAYISNLNSVAYLELGNPWWNQSIVEKSSIYGNVYYATGDISSAYIGNTYAMFFNKDIAEENGLGDIYELYDNNQWTLDRMITMSKQVATEGVYGFATYGTALDAFYQGSEFSLVENAPDGSLLLSDDYTSSEVHDLIGKLVDFKDTGAFFLDEKSEYLKLWNQGNALFVLTDIFNSAGFPEGNAENFGILPMPKYSEDQEAYHSLVGFYYSMYCIPRSSEGDDAVGATLECLASESHRRVTPAYYDDLIKNRISATVKEAMMFDTVRDSVVIDSGRIFQGYIGWEIWGKFRSRITTGSKDWMSVSAELAPGFEEKITNLNMLAETLG